GRRRRALLSDRDRLAPCREGRVRRRAGIRLADGPARACDRQRRLRRRGEPRRSRAVAWRDRTGHRILGRQLRRRSVRGRARRGFAYRGTDADRDRRSQASGDGAAALALPAGPADRRLRRHHPPPHRRMKAQAGTARKARNAATPAALGFRMPAEWEPHAATWLAWPHEPRDWPGKLAPIPW